MFLFKTVSAYILLQLTVLAPHMLAMVYFINCFAYISILCGRGLLFFSIILAQTL